MNNKVVVFDADGVLCNPPFRFAAFLTGLGISRETTREFFADAFYPCLVGKADTKKVLEPFLPKWGWSGSVDSFVEAWHREEHILEPELVKLIQRLRGEGYTVCLATNQDPYRAAHMGLEDLFSRCYYSSAVGAMKPEREYFDYITKDLGVEPGAICFFDDEERYVKGAIGAGWKAFVYADAAQADRLIEGI
jgi:putative hydrolase of the HAD superfamily